jgi:hypothetical protein
MSGKKYSTKQVMEIIECEGLGYAVQYYMSGENIDDPELARLWDDAQEALRKIEQKLTKTLSSA